jgi:PAS domain S-box-containing protein
MGRNPVRVLLVEDQETDYLLTRRLLSSVENQSYDLEWADSWQAGIEAIRRCEYDVCLLDFRIGGGDGLELLKESRDIGCKAPVILLTGVGDYRLDLEAMELGAADFLVKDKLTPAFLERAIRYAIAQSKALKELERQRDELRLSELRFRSVVQSAADAIVIADRSAMIVGWNKGAEIMFGYPEDEIIGSNLEVLMPERYRDRHRAGFERFRLTGRARLIGKTVEMEGLRKDGTVFPLELSLACWSSGDDTMFTGILRDITERTRMEELQQEKESAEEANRSKSSFVARMSHELRSPLHAIIGFTNLLLQNKTGTLSEQDSEFLERILSNAKDQLQLINGILDLSKVEAGRMDVERDQVVVSALVAEVINQIEAEGRNPEVGLNVHAPEVMIPIETDAMKLKQVLKNLVDNALKFTPKGAVTVEVEVSPVNLQPIRINVIDTGVGIPADRLHEIFEPFRQIMDTPRRSEGSGLGLSISRSLCDLLGYRLEVSSIPGQGSTFSIVIGTDPRLLLISA